MQRYLLVQKTRVSELWGRQHLRSALRRWHDVMLRQRAWHRLLMVTATRVRKRNLSLMLFALRTFEAAALSFRTVMKQSERYQRVRDRMAFDDTCYFLIVFTILQTAGEPYRFAEPVSRENALHHGF